MKFIMLVQITSLCTMCVISVPQFPIRLPENVLARFPFINIKTGRAASMKLRCSVLLKAENVYSSHVFDASITENITFLKRHNMRCVFETCHCCWTLEVPFPAVNQNLWHKAASIRIWELYLTVTANYISYL